MKTFGFKPLAGLLLAAAIAGASLASPALAQTASSAPATASAADSGAPASSAAASSAAAAPAAAAAATPAPKIDSGDTAWMLTSSALVLMMTIPGLALFYGGMVRSKNLLSILMQCFAITALVSVLWMLYGYSLAFSTEGMQAGVTNLHSFIGGLDRFFLAGLKPDSRYQTVPESVFVMFQLTFAIITPALIIGAFAERMKFSALLWFSGLWFTIVYLPVAHMVWGGPGSLLGDLGVLDFAGGTVVHIKIGRAHV